MKTKLYEIREEKFNLQDKHDKLLESHASLQSRANALQTIVNAKNEQKLDHTENLMKQNINVELLTKLTKTLENQLKESRAEVQSHVNEINLLKNQNRHLQSDLQGFDVKYNDVLRSVADLEEMVKEVQANLQKQSQLSERAVDEVKKAKDGILYYRQEYQKELNEKKVLKDEITKLQITLEQRKENKDSNKVSLRS